jgi:anti-sigma-K factor RskA
MARYLLGNLAPDESKQIEDTMSFDHNLRREVETAEEELIAAYVVGMLCGEDRVKFETDFLSSEERARKLKFAKVWYEKTGSSCSDLTSAFHRYVLGDLAPGATEELEQKLLFDRHYRRQLEAAEDELLLACFEDTLPEYERELFGHNYFINDRIVRKLRFAHIMREYVKQASVAPSLAVEKAVDRWRWVWQWLFKPVGLSLGSSHIARPVWQPLAAALIGAIVLITWMSLHQSTGDRDLLVLSVTYIEGRPVERRGV